jgi:hypothetical protein
MSLGWMSPSTDIDVVARRGIAVSAEDLPLNVRPIHCHFIHSTNYKKRPQFYV